MYCNTIKSLVILLRNLYSEFKLALMMIMLITHVRNIATGENGLCMWTVCVILYLMFIFFLCTLLVYHFVCIFVMSVFNSSFICQIVFCLIVLY